MSPEELISVVVAAQAVMRTLVEALWLVGIQVRAGMLYLERGVVRTDTDTGTGVCSGGMSALLGLF